VYGAGRRRLKRGMFRSIVELQTAINRSLRETSDDPKPFTFVGFDNRFFYRSVSCLTHIIGL
jgi:hypothetical protein